MIEKRIAELTAEKEQTLKEYASSQDNREVLAERNMRISMELSFLNKLLKIENADRSDAEEFLGNKKDIWNHPRIADRNNKESYEVADLMAEFANEYYAGKSPSSILNESQEKKFKNWQKLFGEELPNIGATGGHFSLEIIYTSIGEVIYGKSWKGDKIDLTEL